VIETCTYVYLVLWNFLNPKVILDDYMINCHGTWSCICFRKLFWVYTLVNNIWNELVHIGNENLEFWVENAKNPQLEHAGSQRCAWPRALGAQSQRASARRPPSGAKRPWQGNFRVVLCSGAWCQSCGGPMRSLWNIFLLFSLILQLEQTWLD
jgi:hypothetical protein